MSGPARRLRVLHVTPYFAPAFVYGGPPRSILGLCQALRAAEVDARVFTTTANGDERLPATTAAWDDCEGVPVRYFPVRTWRRRRFASPDLVRALPDALGHFDLVHIHGLWNAPAWAAQMAARDARVPYVVSPRGMLQPGALRKSRLRKRVAWALRERRNMEGARFLHVTSATEEAAVSARMPGAATVVIPNGVDRSAAPASEAGSFRSRLCVSADAPLVVFVGRLHRIKRLDLLAEAFVRVRATMPTAQLVVAGREEEPVAPAVHAVLAPVADAVHWTGVVSPPERDALLRDAAVLVLCSDSENFGLCVAEALAAGVPVVATRTVPWEDIEWHDCGRWVPQTAGAIAAAVHEILSDPAAAHAMGERGRRLVETKYAWSVLGPQMAAAYADALVPTGTDPEGSGVRV